MVLLLLACATRAPFDDFGPAPAFSLTDQQGATVTEQTFAGKVWLADFMFTTCTDICPMLTANMAEVAARYAGDPTVHFVSFTVDPATDTPPVLAAYAEKYHADAQRWSFLTGPMDQVRQTVVDGFKQSLDREGEGEAATILHGSRFVVVDKKGHIRGFPDPKEPGKVGIYTLVDGLVKE